MFSSILNFSLANERENYLKEKEQSKNKLKQTYDFQIRTRTAQLPGAYDDVEVTIENRLSSLEVEFKFRSLVKTT